jgi:hypothetical protein
MLKKGWTGALEKLAIFHSIAATYTFCFASRYIRASIKSAQFPKRGTGDIGLNHVTGAERSATNVNH